MMLYENINYHSGIRYLISTYIREYDISKANINILYSKGVISLEQYNLCYQMDKAEREKYIGLLYYKIPELDSILKAGIIEAKKMFFEANDIKDTEVLCIKNDAVYLINRTASVTKFGNVEFLNKNTYTSYYKIFDIELYYNFNAIQNIETLDIKGINKQKQKLHESYFIDFLKTLLYSAQNETIESTIDLLNGFANQYINRQLDVNFYRQLDSESRFATVPLGVLKNVYTFDAANMNQLGSLNISYNYNILREFQYIFTSIYMNKKRR